MTTAKTLYFTAPKQLEIRDTALPPLNDDEVLVETICSAISAGTEMLVYCGQFPQLKDAHDFVSSELKYPLAYGYACVGKVKEVGKEVDREWGDKLVFAFRSHTSLFAAKPENLFPIPHSLSPENACFLPNMETAVNLVQDGAPILGERALVLGQGMVGLLTASLLSEFPLESLVVVDQFELRRNALQVENSRLNVERLSPENLKEKGLLNSAPGAKPVKFDTVIAKDNAKETSSFGYAQSKFDLVFELSGSPLVLNDAIEHTAFSGRIVIGSWYGQKRAEIDLGGDFHRSRIRLISSQVSTISPELSGRWDKSRRFDVAWKALERIQPQKWITHRFPIDEADKAYRLMDECPQETMQVIFNYEI
ncbi:MAG: oxidoreductase [Chloroflexi bacterium]|nr:oxidoreductase [Chloroflexota bacterium]MDL1943097.1 zinc-binding alcohol dehydrogenase [Chloroflexi bacterium CFX2]